MLCKTYFKINMGRDPLHLYYPETKELKKQNKSEIPFKSMEVIILREMPDRQTVHYGSLSRSRVSQEIHKMIDTYIQYNHHIMSRLSSHATYKNSIGQHSSIINRINWLMDIFTSVIFIDTLPQTATSPCQLRSSSVLRRV